MRQMVDYKCINKLTIELVKVSGTNYFINYICVSNMLVKL